MATEILLELMKASSTLMLHCLLLLLVLCVGRISAAEQKNEDLLAGHPRLSYEDVADIDAMEAMARPHLGRPR